MNPSYSLKPGPRLPDQEPGGSLGRRKHSRGCGTLCHFPTNPSSDAQAAARLPESHGPGQVQSSLPRAREQCIDPPPYLTRGPLPPFGKRPFWSDQESFGLHSPLASLRCQCPQDEQDHPSPQKGHTAPPLGTYLGWVDMLPSGSLVDKYKEDMGWNLQLFPGKCRVERSSCGRWGLSQDPLHSKVHRRLRTQAPNSTQGRVY